MLNTHIYNRKRFINALLSALSLQMQKHIATRPTYVVALTNNPLIKEKGKICFMHINGNTRTINKNRISFIYFDFSIFIFPTPSAILQVTFMFSMNPSYALYEIKHTNNLQYPPNRPLNTLN